MERKKKTNLQSGAVMVLMKFNRNGETNYSNAMERKKNGK